MKTVHRSLLRYCSIAFIVFSVFILATCSNPTGGGGNDDGTYKLGSTGPGGGRIFYISEEGFTMTDTGEICHYLEAFGPIGTFPWASPGFVSTSIGGTQTAIGSGRENTNLILSKDPDAPAVKACRDYDNSPMHDWFLPSKEELAILYANRIASSIVLGSGQYWSSSEKDSTFAYVYGGSTSSVATEGSMLKSVDALPDDPYSGNKVCPVRAF